ncbi:MAG TPA: TIGR03000 domain-containing protein [Gemmataceae bacterium]|nr:TIGR03000 domain-containing protein [Gemmataceae bacterium]
MFRIATVFTKMTVLAVIGLLATAPTSDAQFRFAYGNHGGTRVGVSVGQPYYGGYYGGRGFYGSPYYQPYYPYGSTYSPYYVTPGYYYQPGYDYLAPTTNYQSFYPPNDYVDQAQMNNTASIQVVCPPNAELWFNGVKTQQTGAVRYFATPPLSGSTNSYEIRASWTDSSGAPVTQVRNINVTPNQQSVVNFTQANK